MKKHLSAAMILIACVLEGNVLANSTTIYTCKTTDDGDPHGNVLALGIEQTLLEDGSQAVIVHLLSDYHGTMLSKPQNPLKSLSFRMAEDLVIELDPKMFDHRNSIGARKTQVTLDDDEGAGKTVFKCILN